MDTTDKPLQEAAGGAVQLARPFWSDKSLWGLFGTNILTLILALVEKWPLGELLWTFWFQSVAIGIFWYLKIRTLENFSTDGLTMDDKPVPATIKSRNQ